MKARALTEFFVKRPTIFWSLVVGIFLVGIVSYINMPKLEDPAVAVKQASVVLVYPGADAAFTLYEDAFEGNAYLKGERSEIVFAWDDKAGTLSVSARKGSFPGMLAKRTFRARLAGTDKTVAIAYAGAKGKNGIMLPGLGKLVLVQRKARMGRNPATGAQIKIPAKKVVKFRVAKAAKDAILGKK